MTLNQRVVNQRVVTRQAQVRLGDVVVVVADAERVAVGGDQMPVKMLQVQVLPRIHLLDRMSPALVQLMVVVMSQAPAQLEDRAKVARKAARKRAKAASRTREEAVDLARDASRSQSTQ